MSVVNGAPPQSSRHSRTHGNVRCASPFASGAGAGENTTIGVAVTNARLSKVECHLAAQSGHDGFARALDPAHTAGDGDALVVAATGRVDAPGGPAIVRALTTYAVEAAILDALARADR